MKYYIYQEKQKPIRTGCIIFLETKVDSVGESVTRKYKKIAEYLEWGIDKYSWEKWKGNSLWNTVREGFKTIYLQMLTWRNSGVNLQNIIHVSIAVYLNRYPHFKH